MHTEPQNKQNKIYYDDTGTSHKSFVNFDTKFLLNTGQRNIFLRMEFCFVNYSKKSGYRYKRNKQVSILRNLEHFLCDLEKYSWITKFIKKKREALQIRDKSLLCVKIIYI